MRITIWVLTGLLYAVSAQAAVTISWRANTEADLAGYLVQYASSCSATFTDLATTKQTTLLDAGHDDGAYRIAAFDTTGQRSAFSPCQFVGLPIAIVTSVTPSTTGATVRWTGTATRLRYASDDTRGYVEVTGVLPTQGLFTHSRPWSRTQSWVCYQVEDAGTGSWTEQGCDNFSGVIWEPVSTEPPDVEPSVPEPAPSPFVIEEHGLTVTLTYSALECPRGIGRSTTGKKERLLALTCLK